MTGTYPSYHRMGADNEILPRELTTIPEAFANAGYRTVGISANPWFSEATGLNRGFNEFEYLNRDSIGSVGIKRILKYLLSLNKHSGGYTTETSKFTTDYLTLGILESKLQSMEDEESPFFLYAHTDGAHTPYYPPKRSLRKFSDELHMSPDAARERVFEIHQNLYREIANGLEFDDATWNALNVTYDALINYIDEQIGHTFDLLKSLDISNTIVVITSDHGDLLGEQGLLSHKVALHDGIINVPLVVHGFDELEADSESIIQHIDVMQTLMNKCDVDAEFLQGKDLTRETREYAIVQRGEDYFWKTMDQVRSYNPDFDLSNYHSSYTNCIRGDSYKLIKSDDKAELLDDSDQPVGSPDSEEALSRMSEALDSRISTIGTTDSSREGAEFSDGMKKRLRDLGYVE